MKNPSTQLNRILFRFGFLCVSQLISILTFINFEILKINPLQYKSKRAISNRVLYHLATRNIWPDTKEIVCISMNPRPISGTAIVSKIIENVIVGLNCHSLHYIHVIHGFVFAKKQNETIFDSRKAYIGFDEQTPLHGIWWCCSMIGTSCYISEFALPSQSFKHNENIYQRKT